MVTRLTVERFANRVVELLDIVGYVVGQVGVFGRRGLRHLARQRGQRRRRRYRCPGAQLRFPHQSFAAGRYDQQQYFGDDRRFKKGRCPYLTWMLKVSVSFETFTVALLNDGGPKTPRASFENP